jgi:hypothetical protein
MGERTSGLCVHSFNRKGKKVVKTVSKKKAKAVEAKVKEFTSREFPEFEKWLQAQWRANPSALLCSNPPNKVYDVEDGTLDLSIGEVAVARKRELFDHCTGGIYAFAIKAEGKLREVVRAIPELGADDQLEAAMAFLLEYRNGSYVCNDPLWLEVAKIGVHSDNLENPFYKGICEAVLEVFRKEGWID